MGTIWARMGWRSSRMAHTTLPTTLTRRRAHVRNLFMSRRPLATNSLKSGDDIIGPSASSPSEKIHGQPRRRQRDAPQDADRGVGAGGGGRGGDGDAPGGDGE